MWDSVFVGCQLAALANTEPYGAVRDGAIGVVNGRISLSDRVPNCRTHRTGWRLWCTISVVLG
jgi:hypothetical protein